jgi:hypothetical protein
MLSLSNSEVLLNVMDEPTAKLYSAVLELIGKLVWPGVLLYALLRFRNQVTLLLTRLGSVKVAGSEWVFQSPTANAPQPSKELTKTKLDVGPDGFLTVSAIHAVVAESGLLDSNESVVGELLIFQTPNQRTWLVASDKKMFIVLDDEETRRNSRLIQTYFDKDRTLPIQCRESDGAGIVRFHAENNWWYYSLQLFPMPDALKEAINRLLKRGAS